MIYTSKVSIKTLPGNPKLTVLTETLYSEYKSADQCPLETSLIAFSFLHGRKTSPFG